MPNSVNHNLASLSESLYVTDGVRVQLTDKKEAKIYFVDIKRS